MAKAPPLSSDEILKRLLALHPKAIDLSLGRIERLLAALGHPEQHLAPVVHVAGTNGKGSTIAFLRAFLEAAGYRVQAYTSPHLVRFAERIRLADGIIEETRLAALLEECERVNAGAEITFFEITTAAAFLAFARATADILLLEVGLGGRLDATNVIERPALAVITPISIDHVDFLGDTIAKIAFEKAGILKPRVAAVVGPQPGEALGVIAGEADRASVQLFRHGEQWTVAPTAGGMRYVGGAWRLDLPRPGLVGVHQIVNAGLAIAAAERLGGFRLAPDHLRLGLARVEWPARLQRLTRGPLVAALPGKGWELWLDGGHNPAAGETLAMQAERWRDRPLGLVFGMLKTKDAVHFLAALASHAAATRTIAIPSEANSLSAEEACRLASSAGHRAVASAGPLAAVRELVAILGRPSRLLICGSLYLAGKVLAENG